MTELRELDSLKSDLIGFVSHELRGPLTSIKSYATTLRSQMERLTVEQQQQFTDVICREVDRLARLVDGFLDVSKIEAGRAIELRLETFDAIALAEEALAIQRNVRSKCTLALEVDEDREETGSIPLSADRDKVLQVLLNLLSNAVKYSPDGGDVVLRVIRCGEQGVRFEVLDEGLGMEASQLQQLFTPFHRVRDVRTRSIRGTGLGLHLSKHLVEAHGGRIWVDSKPGEGSRFFFTIPQSTLREGV